ncbi:fungal protease inhibitor-1-like [Bombyx mandarina]|uniref:Uncharacterized protein n=3 Tax=cellular organisms TaxID=131567 RepID=A0A5B2V916_9PSEU|nr:fungal protease inhibitor-1-like [Bombyx mandarina]KAA2235491.1 hypothetical protein F0L68_41910 [Solihabitans fulvus]
MKTLIFIMLVACVASAAYGALVCGTDYCEKNPCIQPPLVCPKNTEHRARHAGKCACCPACVTLLGEGATCKIYSKELGETPSAVCKEPLKCIKRVCTKLV